MPQKSKSLIFVRNLLIVAVCCLVAYYITQHLRVPLTHSLSKRVFWAIGYDPNGNVRTGRYIIFDQFVPAPHSRVVRFIKRAGCTSGETLKVEKDYYFCNGEYIGHAKRKSLKGDPLTPFVFNGTVPEGVVFAIGDHPDSYDSRYVGFISHHRVQEVAWALF